MMDSMHNMVDTWDPDQVKSTFSTDKSQLQNQGKSDYFLDSADRVHFFTEKDAQNEEKGEILQRKALQLTLREY